MEPADQIQLQLTNTLLQAGRNWQQMANTVLTRFGISLPAGVVMLQIGRHGEGISQIALAQLIGIDSASLVRTLDQLCANQLIRREKSPQDQRVNTLWYTDTGRSLSRSIEEALAKLRDSVFQSLPLADLEACLRVFTVLEAARSRQVVE